MSICSLPDELLEAVALHCSDTKNLRLVNRRVYEAIEHVLWKSHALNVDIRTDGLSENNVPMLKEFMSGCKTSVPEMARRLRIVYQLLDPRLEDTGLDLDLSAIQKLRSVRTFDRIPVLPLDALCGGKLTKISLHGDPSMSEVRGNLMSTLAQAIRSNKRLSHLTLNWNPYYRIPRVPLLQFSTLFRPALPASLALQTLHLARWKFDFGHPNVTPHLSHLRSLDLTGCEYQDDALWKLLSTQQVSLRRISVETISNELFDYMELISGLEELLLTYFEPEDPILFEELSEQLFYRIIPRHQHTLRVLCIEPDTESLEWAICYHNMHILNLCKGLTHLTIGLGFEFEGEDDSDDSYDEIHTRHNNVVISLILNLTSNHLKLERLTLAELSYYRHYILDIDRLLGSIRILLEETAIPHFEILINTTTFWAKIETGIQPDAYIGFEATRHYESTTEEPQEAPQSSLTILIIVLDVISARHVERDTVAKKESQCKTSELVRTLKIVHGGAGPGPENKVDEDLRLSALRRLKNVRTFIWRACFIADMPDSVIQSLQSFSLLKELVMHYSNIPALPSDVFCGGNLTKISLRGDPSEVEESLMHTLGHQTHTVHHAALINLPSYSMSMSTAMSIIAHKKPLQNSASTVL
ncbi:hypothetical protein AAF712_003382 [Marasmius tenuissimus]|uniref:F-box domain-containing protein n=1 Tax=Marasmius tenuissimus TaxID=585030 RepID=A0ABR3A8Q2_9AGAR